MATRRASLVTTPWGKASVVEEASLPQRSGEKRFGSIVQLLETPDGDRLVRFAYTTDGSARRGPVTFRAQDIRKLRTVLARSPQLQEALREGLS